MAFRQRNRRIKPNQVEIHESAEAIFVRYFCSIGLACESGLTYHSPEWHSAFKVKFGKPEFRKQAWAMVRSTVRQLMPSEVFVQMDAYFSDGEGLHFTNGFSNADKL